MNNSQKILSSSASKLLEDNIYLNMSQLMKLFSFSRNTLYKVMKRPDFPKCLALTNRKLWKKTDIIKWADSNMVDSSKEK